MIEFSTKIRLGYLTLSAPLFNQEVVARMHNSALQGLEKTIPNLELVCDDKPVLELSASREAAKKLRREDVDAVLLNYAGWHCGDGTIAIAKELWDTPFMLWAYGVSYGEWMITLTGLMEATSGLEKIGKRFAVVLGEPEEKALKKVHSFLKAASAAKMIRNVNLGIVSYPCPGMLDTTPDPMALRRKLGTALVNLDITELLSLYEKIPEEEAKKLADDLLSGYGREVDQQNIVKSVRMYLALRMMVKKYDLRGFAVRCWPEMMVDHRVSPCLGISKLTSEGVMGVCEGDMHSTATMLILYELAGSLPCCLDLNTMDERENSITLWHCGANAAELAEDPSRITLRYPLLSE
ncbi:MAG: hypothetical protein ACE5PO_01450, partial [Candidatus Bathyarchaeia archaeon]